MPAKCPYCYSELGNWTNDPLLVPEGAKYVFISDTELQEIEDTEQRFYKGLSSICRDHLIDLQNNRIELELQNLPEAQRTAFTPINDSGYFQITGQHIKELRESTEKLLDALSLTKQEYFNYDADENHIIHPNGDKLDWTDVIENDEHWNKFQIKAVHIEDLRHPIIGVSPYTWIEDYIRMKDYKIIIEGIPESLGGDVPFIYDFFDDYDEDTTYYLGKGFTWTGDKGDWESDTETSSGFGDIIGKMNNYLDSGEYKQSFVDHYINIISNFQFSTPRHISAQSEFAMNIAVNNPTVYLKQSGVEKNYNFQTISNVVHSIDRSGTGGERYNPGTRDKGSIAYIKIQFGGAGLFDVYFYDKIDYPTPNTSTKLYVNGFNNINQNLTSLVKNYFTTQWVSNNIYITEIEIGYDIALSYRYPGSSPYPIMTVAWEMNLTVDKLSFIKIAS